MLLWAEILRSIPLPTVSLFPENKDIANGSTQYNIVQECIILQKRKIPV